MQNQYGRLVIWVTAHCSVIRDAAVVVAAIINWTKQFRESRKKQMDLRRMGILMLICAAALGIVAYESYRFNVVAVEKLVAKAGTEAIFNKLEAAVPIRAQITGFFAIMFGVAGLKLLVTKRESQTE